LRPASFAVALAAMFILFGSIAPALQNKEGVRKVEQDQPQTRSGRTNTTPASGESVSAEGSEGVTEQPPGQPLQGSKQQPQAPQTPLQPAPSDPGNIAEEYPPSALVPFPDDETSEDQQEAPLRRAENGWIPPLPTALLFAMATLLGGLLGYAFCVSRFVKLEDRVSRHKRDQISDLNAIMREIVAIKSGAAAQGRASDGGREPEANAAPRKRADGLISPPARADELPAPSAGPQEEGAWSVTGDADKDWIVRAYRELLASGSPELSDMMAKFDHFSEVRGIRVTEGTGTIGTGRYRGDDKGELLVALGNGGDLLIVPAYDYLIDFRSIFNIIVQNPQFIRRYFEADVDRTCHARLIAPARARLDEAGQLVLVGPGRLSGFMG